MRSTGPEGYGGERVQPVTLLKMLQVMHTLEHNRNYPKERKREMRAKLIKRVLETPEEERESMGINVVVSVPRKERDPDLVSDNLTVSVVYPRQMKFPRDYPGEDGFIRTRRSSLIRYVDAQQLDQLVLTVGDIREETLWERQKRLIMEITTLDKMLENTQADAMGDELIRRKYKHVFAFLVTSKQLLYQFRELKSFYNIKVGSERIRLTMIEPREGNLPQRLRRKKEDPPRPHLYFSFTATDRHITNLYRSQLENGTGDTISNVLGISRSNREPEQSGIGGSSLPIIFSQKVVDFTQDPPSEHR